MNLPVRKLYAHMLSLAAAPTLTYADLVSGLQQAGADGFTGMIVVAKILMDRGISPNAVREAFNDAGMDGLCCGFLPGDNFNPHDPSQHSFCTDELLRQAEYARALNPSSGPSIMVGPVDIGWRSTEVYSRDLHWRWLEELAKFSTKHDVRFAIEPLNDQESNATDPFRTILQAIQQWHVLRLHLDIGHWIMRGHNLIDLGDFLPYVALWEWANLERWPLDTGKGIVFADYAHKMASAKGVVCKMSIEPFSPQVIAAFGLGGLCKTNIPGAEAQRRDITFLREIGVVL